jgi:RNA recognition motif-containing protein
VVISNLSAHCTPDLLYEFFILCGHIEDIIIFRYARTRPHTHTPHTAHDSWLMNDHCMLQGAKGRRGD